MLRPSDIKLFKYSCSRSIMLRLRLAGEGRAGGPRRMGKIGFAFCNTLHSRLDFTLLKNILRSSVLDGLLFSITYASRRSSRDFYCKSLPISLDKCNITILSLHHGDHDDTLNPQERSQNAEAAVQTSSRSNLLYERRTTRTLSSGR
jgi:hypothetical protein